MSDLSVNDVIVRDDVSANDLMTMDEDVFIDIIETSDSLEDIADIADSTGSDVMDILYYDIISDDSDGADELVSDAGYEDVDAEDSHETISDVNDSGETLSDTGVANYEARSVWITRWDYEKSKNNGPQSIAAIMKNISDANFNMVYFQVRGRADAYYKSSYEPWASEFTGTLGADPGWDPLMVAV
ncbi:MAG: family 10 glycosylhydrolase, partial [Deltaproteobacteria bacterium]|nr:family 10 glycosylhydrolase [Deltaproteobacteria bacterium]